MNAGMKLVTVYVGGAILIAGCGQSNSGNSNPNQPAAPKPAESKIIAPNDATIKVKGLYIGMDIHAVPAALLKEKLVGMNCAIIDATKDIDMLASKNCTITDAAKGSAITAFTGKHFGDFDYAGQQYVMAFGLNLEPEYFFASIGSRAGQSTLGVFIATPDGKAISILLKGAFVNDLFNAADMDASAFVQQFISAYNIPEMKVSDNLQSWTYTSPKGEKITIDTMKNVMIEKVESAQDRKQSFN